VERPRGVFEEVAELRATVMHLASDMTEVKQDIRRLDDRLFQVLLIQLATLATALGSLIAALVAATH
jgi:Flp pilus assembly CpaE family ATPase